MMHMLVGLKRWWMMGVGSFNLYLPTDPFVWFHLLCANEKSDVLNWYVVLKRTSVRHLMGLLTLINRNVLAYNKATKKTKKPLFLYVDTLKGHCVPFADMIPAIESRKGAYVRKRPRRGFFSATDLADFWSAMVLLSWCARRCGKAVACVRKVRIYLKMKLEKLQSFVVWSKRMFRCFDIRRVVAARNHIGRYSHGSSAESVKQLKRELNCSF